MHHFTIISNSWKPNAPSLRHGIRLAPFIRMNQLVRKNEELSAILQVSQVLTSSLDLEKNLYAAMQILAGRLGMQRGCVFLLEARRHWRFRQYS